MTTMDELLIFKTTIRYKKDLARVSLVLNSHEDICEWNVDLHDIDKVLRIRCSRLNAEAINNIIQLAGYNCEQLED